MPSISISTPASRPTEPQVPAVPAEHQTDGPSRSEEYVDLVLSCVEGIPRGRVMAYGDVAEVVGRVFGGGGPRQVAAVMAREGAAVPWWRVVRADGSLPVDVAVRARPSWLEEGTPLRADGRVEMGSARVRPSLEGK